MKIVCLVLTILLALIGGAFLEAKIHVGNGEVSTHDSYDSVMLQLPKKNTGIALLRKQILLNKAQGVILEGLYQDELRKEQHVKKK